MNHSALRAALAAALVLLSPLAAAAETAPGRAAGAGVASDRATPLVDINSAGEDELRMLPGVGPARAQAIIAGRPYLGKDDLLKRNVLPKNIYDGVKDRIVAKRK